MAIEKSACYFFQIMYFKFYFLLHICLFNCMAKISNQCMSKLKSNKRKHEFYFILFYFLTHIFLLYWMWQSHAFHSPLLLFFHCLWFACQEELLFLLLLPVSRKWVIYDFTCVKDAVSLFKKHNKPKNRMFAIFMTAKNIFFWTLKL